MKLYFRETGQGFPLIILHGLYGSSDNWLTIARELSANFRVIVPDLRNHGRSPHSSEHSYPAMAVDVLELMDDLAIGQCFVIGHSMGGKTAMHLASGVPRKIAKLVIVDISPLNYSMLTGYSPLAVEHLNIADALLHTDLQQYTRRKDMEQSWAAKIPETNTRRFLLKNIQRDDRNHYAWRINIRVIVQNLPNILNGMDDLGLGNGNRIEIPALFVKGERSPYIQPEICPFIHQAFPNAQIVTIPEAGHWPHVEKPDIFLNELIRFLSTN
jgi:pimeloyl-ACP methyl ester carboxylesterase